MILYGGHLFLNGNPAKIRQVERETINYIVVQKGHEVLDLIEIQGEYEWRKGGYYYTKVTYKDDPSEVYIYTYDKDGHLYLWTSTN